MKRERFRRKVDRSGPSRGQVPKATVFAIAQVLDRVDDSAIRPSKSQPVGEDPAEAIRQAEQLQQTSVVALSDQIPSSSSSRLTSRAEGNGQVDRYS